MTAIEVLDARVFHISRCSSEATAAASFFRIERCLLSANFTLSWGRHGKLSVDLRDDSAIHGDRIEP